LLRIVSILVILFLIYGCAPSARYADTREILTSSIQKGSVLIGKASYYGKKFHGRKTANGEIFDMYSMTAAHRQLPFNTILEITNKENGKSVQVRINDRGPFKADRIVDLSYQAARKLDMLKKGVVMVEVRIIKLGKD
jgi:rare lipoprotein A